MWFLKISASGVATTSLAAMGFSPAKALAEARTFSEVWGTRLDKGCAFKLVDID